MCVCVRTRMCKYCIPSSPVTLHVLTVDTGRVWATADNKDLYKSAESRSSAADCWASGRDQTPRHILIPSPLWRFWLIISSLSLTWAALSYSSLNRKMNTRLTVMIFTLSFMTTSGMLSYIHVQLWLYPIYFLFSCLSPCLYSISTSA